MKKISTLILASIVVTVLTIVFTTEKTISNQNGPAAGVCGAPSDGGTDCTDCHNTYAASTAAGWITTNIPAAGYTPGATYTVTATATYAGLVRFGFQISPQNASGTKLGTLVVTDATNTQLKGSSKYVEHKSAGTTGTTGSHTWTFNWIAPAAGSGSVTFYGAFNCANNMANESGDHIVKSTTTVNELTCNLTAAIGSSGALQCPGDSTTLTASGGTAFIWNTGATTAAIHVPAGTYSVTVSNASGCTATTNTNVAAAPCSTPTGVTATNVFGNKATLSWNAVGCAAKYRIQYRVTGTTTWTTTTVTAPTATKTLSNLLPLTSYDYQVRTDCNAAGTSYSSYSATQTFTTLCNCEKPTAITVSNVTATSAVFNWIGNACAVKYRIQYRVNGTTTWATATITAPLLTKTINNLTANTTYQYHLRSDCNTAGTFNSGFTTNGTFTTSLRMEDASYDLWSNSFSVLPNPNDGKFVLQFVSNSDDVALVKVLNLTGQMVWSESVDLNAGSNALNFSLENLSSGIYLLEINSSTGIFRKKLELIK